MAAVPNLPFFSTSYGDNFGYNERDGSNTASFRNRYWNQSFRGTAQLGPVRFQGQRSAAEQDLPHLNVTRPVTAEATLARTQPLPQAGLSQSQQFGATTARQPLYHPESEAYTRAAAAQTAQPRSWEQEQNRTSRFEQQAAAQRQGQEQRFDAAASGSYAAPTGVYTAPVQSVFARSAGPQYSQRLAQPYETQSLQQARLQQSAMFGDSVSARYALPAPNAAPSVNSSPYYIPPYEAPPSSSFAPSARALGNKTYEFELDDPSKYAFTSSFRGMAPVSSKPAQDAGQSIPYGRLQAEDAREVRHKMAMSSWDTFNVAERDGSNQFNLDGIETKRKAAVDPEAYCKWSISRRLPVGDQMRYQIPGYCGYVPTEKMRHGSTYGKTTRLAMAGSPEGM